MIAHKHLTKGWWPYRLGQYLWDNIETQNQFKWWTMSWHVPWCDADAGKIPTSVEMTDNLINDVNQSGQMFSVMLPLIWQKFPSTRIGRNVRQFNKWCKPMRAKMFSVMLPLIWQKFPRWIYSSPSSNCNLTIYRPYGS